MARVVTFIAIVAAIAASGALVARVPAQQLAPAPTELLTEVRLLRQAIESLTGTNARVQIVFGRLTLQEQRVSNAAQRLDDARAALTKITQEIDGMTEHARVTDNVLNDGRRKPDELEQARAEAATIRRALERREIDRARLAGDEAEAASALNQEQGRWSDLNRQLEELERALVKQ
jgi:septation ring formation regulator EzrA